ncbi:hypothetical protein [Pyxidicoccus xibeiensis]|uniref:hypothetical protein n=1 Tax=Pyxidicoccus xibeiensis TaxID=2906759 RepID=UPI0020A777B1|nr:hypothetical protein [Pyxidicoccus xibeiensis]MCP3143091.1 hypothetical protein [Pyxidicoccus xibeiensis]
MRPERTPTGFCQDEGGFLFPHPCGRPASASCMRCGKLVCGRHLSTVDAELVCSTCAREDSDDDSEDETQTSAREDEDDPSYYYEDYGYYGPGSSLGGDKGHDPNDFTEADGESLRHEDDASFEEDLGGS